jgi:hypothetical protein
LRIWIWQDASGAQSSMATPEEVRDLRRVAEVMDGKTPHAMEALGKGRLFRSRDRPTRLIAEAAAAVVALTMSIVLFAGHGLLSALLRTLRRIAR